MTPDEKRRRVLEIQARVEKLPSGRWKHETGRVREGGVGYFHTVWTGEMANREWVGEMRGYAADFLAESHSDVPWLCEELLKMLDFQVETDRDTHTR